MVTFSVVEQRSCVALAVAAETSFVIAVSLAIVSPEFNPTSVILCLSLKTIGLTVNQQRQRQRQR